MFNKQIMKKVFDDRFNIDDMRNQILLKKERKNDKMINRIFKLSISVCLVLLCYICVFKFNATKNIHINKLDNFSHGDSVFEVDEVEIVKIPEKFDFILKLKVPKSLMLVRQYNIYTRSNIEVDEFDILRDYVLEYSGAGESKIVISFSEIGKPLKDYKLIEEVPSKINNTDVFISKYQGLYIVSFSYNGLYFVVEANSINDKELITLLESIIK